MKRILVFLLLILFGGNPVLAGSGNELLDQCKGAIRTIDTKDYANADLFDVGLCFGYLHGSREAFVMSVTTLKIAGTYDNEVSKAALPCIPEQVEVGQLARIFIKYAQSHPEELHERDTLLVRRAFVKAFPCK